MRVSPPTCSTETSAGASGERRRDVGRHAEVVGDDPLVAVAIASCRSPGRRPRGCVSPSSPVGVTVTCLASKRSSRFSSPITPKRARPLQASTATPAAAWRHALQFPELSHGSASLPAATVRSAATRGAAWQTGGATTRPRGEPDYRFTLANERTFLAWVRTSLGLLAAGVAVRQLVEPFGIEGGRTTLAMLGIAGQRRPRRRRLPALGQRATGGAARRAAAAGPARPGRRRRRSS